MNGKEERERSAPKQWHTHIDHTEEFMVIIVHRSLLLTSFFNQTRSIDLFRLERFDCSHARNIVFFPVGTRDSVQFFVCVWTFCLVFCLFVHLAVLNSVQFWISEYYIGLSVFVALNRCYHGWMKVITSNDVNRKYVNLTYWLKSTIGDDFLFNLMLWQWNLHSIIVLNFNIL